jgi:hypothetical protein
MKYRISALFLVAALATAVHPSASAQQENWGQGHKPKLVPFDAPGTATKSTPACAPLCGTLAYANNDFGVIVGYYTDPQVVPHAFLRTPDGHITLFNAPGDGEGAGLNQGTVAYAINDFGVIAGQFQDSKYLYHGFVREPDGNITPFEAMGAGTGAGQGTLAWGVNMEGATAGVYIDDGNTEHGFFRSATAWFRPSIQRNRSAPWSARKPA